jgi:hypothetical protein
MKSNSLTGPEKLTNTENLAGSLTGPEPVPVTFHSLVTYPNRSLCCAGMGIETNFHK